MPNIIKKHTLVNFTNKKINVKYLVDHDTGVKGQTAKSNANYFYNTFRGASAGYFVDKNDIYEVVPPGKVSWHIGDDKAGDQHDIGDLINNHNTIGIEMCAEKDGSFHPNTISNAAWLTQKLMKEHNVPASRVVRHYDASGKNCPQFMNRDGKWTLWKKYHSQLTGQSVVSAPSGTFIGKEFVHKVVAGDTLWGLSKQYNATVDQIKEWNNIKSDTIVIGDTLKIKANNQPTDNPEHIETVPAKVDDGKLVVDGLLGRLTIRAWQKALGTPADGVISKPSTMIKELQRLLGVTIDGWLGKETISALQRYLSTPVDGEIWEPSAMIKELQRRLNAGTFNPKPATSGKQKSSYKGNSLVDYLKSIKVDSSPANRKKLAAKYGIKNYKGTAAQNLQLLNKMR
ncbi:N-acetylmuramoyl-L-alanine amidase [Desemzia sp. C1]|uniref:N-acetylmuramoyl-L-alanine amidase n=1 Tax=Desemzia sp. C1 TaxID=2892016 RepID=UPI001E4FD4AB|nr:N-acetylmuramoyl-L-alanine amidase [Desemzia sp. C1]MCI3027667.1 N-acetylmuramoyl-L-alanine amidase [Desemzia sp. C1]